MDYSSTMTFDFMDDDDDEYFLTDGTPDSDNEINADTGDPCTICSGRLIKTGLHMATSLKCGHQFGYWCVSQWLKRHNYCPTCNLESSKRHMKGVYQRIENSWDRTPTEEDLAAMEGKSMNQAGRGDDRRANRRADRRAEQRAERRAEQRAERRAERRAEQRAERRANRRLNRQAREAEVTGL